MCRNPTLMSDALLNRNSSTCKCWIHILKFEWNYRLEQFTWLITKISWSMFCFFKKRFMWGTNWVSSSNLSLNGTITASLWAEWMACVSLMLSVWLMVSMCFNGWAVSRLLGQGHNPVSRMINTRFSRSTFGEALIMKTYLSCCSTGGTWQEHTRDQKRGLWITIWLMCCTVVSMP